MIEIVIAERWICDREPPCSSNGTGRVHTRQTRHSLWAIIKLTTQSTKVVKNISGMNIGSAQP